MKDVKIGKIAAWGSLGLNAVLFAAKMWIGSRNQSVSMVADAWHTLADSFTSAIVLLGFHVAAQPADAKHPFGHGRAESICAVVVATLLGVIGFEFLTESIARLREVRTPAFTTMGLVVFGGSAVAKEIMAQVSIRVGGRLGSRSLVADGWHHRSDAIASLVIVVGAFLGGRFWWMDGVLGITVAMLIFYTVYEIIREVSGRLLGEGTDSDLETRVRAIVADVAPEVTAVHHLHTHRYGDHVELTLHFTLPGALTLDRSHHISEHVEKAIRERLGVESTIHVEPAREG